MSEQQAQQTIFRVDHGLTQDEIDALTPSCLKRWPIEEVQLQPGYIYIIKPKGTSGVYKIGESVNALRRQIQAQRTKDYEIELIAYYPVKDKWRIEQQLHAHYKRYHLAGEWFAFPDSILESVAKMIGLLDGAL